MLTNAARNSAEIGGVLTGNPVMNRSTLWLRPNPQSLEETMFVKPIVGTVTVVSSMCSGQVRSRVRGRT